MRRMAALALAAIFSSAAFAQTARIQCVGCTEARDDPQEPRSPPPSQLPDPSRSRQRWIEAQTRTSLAPVTRPEFGLVARIKFVNANGDAELCSGTFISGNRVLTAGHCACGVPSSYGIAVASRDNRGFERSFRLAAPPALFDPSICVQGIKAGNDLALLATTETKTCIGQTSGVKPSIVEGSEAIGSCEGFVPIEKVLGRSSPSVWALRGEIVERRTQVNFAGYGQSEFNPLGGQRLTASLPVTSTVCEPAALSGICAAFTEMLIEDSRNVALRRDTCPGDSGGPVFHYRGDRAILIGVTSRAANLLADDPGLPCGGGGIYTLIGRKSVFEWLRANGVATPPLEGATNRFVATRSVASRIAARKALVRRVAARNAPFGSLAPLGGAR